MVPANTRHNLGSNIAFCDGHATWLSASTIMGYIAPAGNTFMNPWGLIRQVAFACP